MNEIIPSVCVFDAEFPNPEYIYSTVESLIEKDIRLNWKWAQTSGSTENLQNAHRTNQEFHIGDNRSNEVINEIDSLIFNGITNQIQQYSEIFKTGVLEDEGYSLLKYENGTHYKMHHDCGGTHRDRVVSIVVYLNDDYVGGELTFPLFNKTYKPNAGDIVIFPSNYTFAHIAQPVTSGTKYAIVSWMHYGDS